MRDAEHDTTHRASRNSLILEDILRFSIQLVGELVDPSNLVFERRNESIAQKTSDRFGHERCPIGRNVVDLFREFVGKCDVHAHAIKVSQEHAGRQQCCGARPPEARVGAR